MRRIIIAFIVPIANLGGCTWLNAPQLYGNKSCGENKTAYVYTSGTVAICLSERSVAYMVCSRELGVISDTKKSTANGTLSTPISGVTSQAGVTVGVDSAVNYAADGELARARAKAIETCVDIYNSYR